VKFADLYVSSNDDLDEFLVGDSLDRHHDRSHSTCVNDITKSNRFVSPRKGCFRFPWLSTHFVAEQPGHRGPYSVVVNTRVTVPGRNV